MLEKKCKVVSLFGVEVGDEVLDGHWTWELDVLTTFPREWADAALSMILILCGIIYSLKNLSNCSLFDQLIKHSWLLPLLTLSLLSVLYDHGRYW
jgi:hypothetical protein